MRDLAGQCPGTTGRMFHAPRIDADRSADPHQHVTLHTLLGFIHRPTGTIVSACIPKSLACNAMRATPDLSGAMVGESWLIPSGKTRTTSRLYSASVTR